jgi:hypothetical protein
MKYDFFQAEHPWGPWSFIRSYSDNFIGGNGHMYGPSLCAKFQEAQGSSVNMSLFTSGCPFEDRPTGLYKIWRIPIVLKTTPVEPSMTVKHDDPRITYEGTSPQLKFTGTGVDCLATKGPGLGSIEVYLDGNLKQEVSLRLDDFPPLSRVAVFSARDLPAGTHIIRVASKGTNPTGLDGFRIYQAGSTGVSSAI